MRVLIVDDSVIIRSILKDVFNHDKEIEIVGEASNGKAAIEKNISLKPDLIILDIKMPVMDGITAAKHIMKNNPVPILIFSGELEAANSFEAYQVGAVDVLKKPDIGNFNDPIFFNNFRELLLSLGFKNKFKTILNNTPNNNDIQAANKDIKLVVMGASTGGPKAVNEIIKRIPGSFPKPIVLVQHLESGFENEYVSWLNHSSKIRVKLAYDQEKLQPEILYVAPSDKHIKIFDDRIIYDDGLKVLNQKPAVDILFSSAADFFGKSLLGVLLTGMGRDGAQGCLDIIKKNGTTIIQDEETSAIFGMPKAAIELNAASYVLPLQDIADAIIKISRG